MGSNHSNKIELSKAAQPILSPQSTLNSILSKPSSKSTKSKKSTRSGKGKNPKDADSRSIRSEKQDKDKRRAKSLPPKHNLSNIVSNMTLETKLSPFLEDGEMEDDGNLTPRPSVFATGKTPASSERGSIQSKDDRKKSKNKNEKTVAVASKHKKSKK